MASLSLVGSWNAPCATASFFSPEKKSRPKTCPRRWRLSKPTPGQHAGNAPVLTDVANAPPVVALLLREVSMWGQGSAAAAGEAADETDYLFAPLVLSLIHISEPTRPY